MIPPAEVLAQLDPRAIVTVMVPAGELLAAMQRHQRQGPARLSSREAAAEFGWRAADWNRWAREDEEVPMFPGTAARPTHKEGGHGWNFPREWCQAMFDRKMKRPGRQQGPQQQTKSATPRLSDTRGNHGPRSKRTAEQQQPTRAPHLQAVR